MRRLVLDDGCGFVMVADRTAKCRITKFDGWSDGPSIKRKTTESDSDGMYAAELYRSGRKMTLAGRWWFDTPEETIRMAHTLSGIFASGEVSNGSISVTDEGGDWLVDQLSIDGSVKTDYDVASCFLTFEIPLMTPDPAIYGQIQRGQLYTPNYGQGLEFPLFDDQDTLRTMGTLEYGSPEPAPVVFHNYGNQISYPTFIVRGEFPSGFRIEMVNDRIAYLPNASRPGIEYRYPVTAGSPVTVDMRGRVIVDGWDASHALSRRDWGGVPPRMSVAPVLRSLQSDADGWADYEFRSRYI